MAVEGGRGGTIAHLLDGGMEGGTAHLLVRPRSARGSDEAAGGDGDAISSARSGVLISAFKREEGTMEMGRGSGSGENQYSDSIFHESSMRCGEAGAWNSPELGAGGRGRGGSKWRMT